MRVKRGYVVRVVSVCASLGVVLLVLAFLNDPAGRLGPDEAEEIITTSKKETVKTARPSVVEIGPAMLRTGDLIFRKGRSNESRIVMLLDRGSPFSHVGLVQKVGGAAFVIHIVPGNPEKQRNVVRRDSLSAFLAPDAASAAGVYRLKEQHQHYAKPAVEVALSYLKNRIVFDDAYDTKSPDKLYCTELIWRAYQGVRLDLTAGNLDRLSIPFAQGTYVLPSTLYESEYFRTVYSSIP